MIKSIAFAALAAVSLTGLWVESANAGTTHLAAAKKVKYAAVQKVLDTNCTKCHGAKGPGQIDLRSYDSVMKGGGQGKIVEPGNAKTSVLAKALHGNGVRQMPPRGPLKPTDVKLIEDWITQGAKNVK